MTEVKVRADVSVVAAFAILREGQNVTAEALGHFAHDRLAAYKCPREWYFVASLPRTANGKVQRKKLSPG